MDETQEAKLSADEIQQAAIARWFTEKWRDPACSICGEHKWAPNPRLGQIPNLPVPGSGGDRTVPVLVITCRSCGHSALINAIFAGVIEEEAGEQEEQVHAQGGDA